MAWYGQIQKDHASCCVCKKCEERGCRFLMPQGKRLVLNGTNYGELHLSEGKLCDCLIFWHHDVLGPSIVVVELKGGRVPSRVLAQLQAGANIITDLIDDAVKPSFAAVLVKGGGIHAEEYKALMRRHVLFRSKAYPIQILKCEASISDVKPWKVSSCQ